MNLVFNISEDGSGTSLRIIRLLLHSQTTLDLEMLQNLIAEITEISDPCLLHKITCYLF